MTLRTQIISCEELQEKLAASLEERCPKVGAEVEMEDCKADKLEVIHEDTPSFVEYAPDFPGMQRMASLFTLIHTLKTYDIRWRLRILAQWCAIFCLKST